MAGRRMSRKKWAGSTYALGAGAVLFLLAPQARAEVVTGPCAEVMDPNNAPILDPRLDHIEVDGVHVNVLVPPDYRDDGRPYPVLYLFHGAFSDEDSFTTQTDLIAFTSQFDRDEQAIVVMPDGGHLPAGRDWADGTHHQETFVIDTLLPYIDANYRTIRDRWHRAAAGFSAGGMNAMVFAARHPDLFVAAGSFSGFVDPFEPDGIGVVQQFVSLDNELCGASDDPNGLWGDPAVDPMGWIGHDPVDLVAGLEDVSLYIASGNGVPCPDNPSPDPFLEFAEGVVYAMSQSLDQALTSAGIAHTTDFASCGVHLFSNANQDLVRFWPLMLDAFGRRPPPPAFDYRTGDPSASVWGWAFAADPLRAPEFLGVRGASAGGLDLTGSGTESVSTARLFSPNEFVSVEGAASAPFVVRADDEGRISFAVDLGAAHTLEEFTPAEEAAESSDPNYFVTRHVQMSAISDGDDDQQ